jgi:imidazolonepropionase-like amidohydrolase
LKEPRDRILGLVGALTGRRSLNVAALVDGGEDRVGKVAGSPVAVVAGVLNGAGAAGAQLAGGLEGFCPGGRGGVVGDAERRAAGADADRCAAGGGRKVLAGARRAVYDAAHFAGLFRGSRMKKKLAARGMGVLVAAVGVVVMVVGVGRGQPPTTVPPDGLRENTPAVHALVNAKVVLSPGRAIERGTIVLRDGVIVAVGASGDVAPPADARVWDLSGQVVYPGLIDAYSELGETAAATGGTRGTPGTPGPDQELVRPIAPAGGAAAAATGVAAAGVSGGAVHWNSRVAAQTRVESLYRLDAAVNRRWRGQGVVARLVAPGRQIVKGTSAAVGTGDGDASHAILRPSVAMHVQLTPAGRGERAYPVSPMGAVALVRQAMYDAQWYGKARAAWEADPSLPRPERNDALEALQGVVSGAMPLMVDAPDEQYFMRADRLGREFKLNVVVRGSGQEYRRLEDVAGTGRVVVVPVNFTRPPNVASPEAAMAYSLTDLLDWDLQPENPARLERAGVRIALTGYGLRDPGTFLAAVRKAVARGLSADGALRALTTTPAELLGLSRSHGTIEVGKAASLLVADGELFAERTKVIETWVDGVRYEVTPRPKEDVRGVWAVTLGAGRPVTVRFSGEPTRLRGRLVPAGGASRPTTAGSTGPGVAPAGRGGRRGATTQADGVELANLSMSGAQLAFTFKGDALRLDGVVQVSATISGDSWIGSGARPDGTAFTVTAKRTGGYGREEQEQDRRDARRRGVGGDPGPDEQGEGGESGGTGGARPTTRAVEAVASAPERREAPVGERERPTTMVSPTAGGAGQQAATQPAPAALARSAERASTRPALFEVNYPLGAFGRTGEPEQPAAVLFKDATVWTSGPRGRIAKASVLVERGKITGVFAEGEAAPKVPEGAVVIDCAGRHLSPGIIDCHSHVATDGGINEGSQSITCEVRIADFIDPDDVNIYRQLGGGVTAANVLHGSANTIGGQNQVIKMRWGASGEGMKFAEAVPGVKFALGENVKRSNFETGAVTGASRYPASRMGVEQLVRDAFSSARDYRRTWDAYRSSGRGIPPRVDLELEALCEIVEGRRIIHCHSYRQDEILALIRTCEAFGVRVAVFQHVLEGYKVADAIARHGAAGSTFSDWWAYKAEAFDAIPYNGAVMHQSGVNVSFNSDDAELARRLNLEAGKAVKYGGVGEEEALKFVTLNPAEQLRIDQYVGSVEVGKHADLVVWSGSPMSALGRCEQTWVDGRRYFDRDEDAKMRTRAREMRAALVQKILGGGERMGEGEEEGPRPRDVWKHSEECRACDCGFVYKR